MLSVILATEPPQLGALTETPDRPLPLRPLVTSTDPSTGGLAGGTKVRIGGENFIDTSAVFFGPSRAQSFSVDPGGTSLSAVSPSGEGMVHISVITPGGTSAATEADRFTFLEPTPFAVIDVEPKTGISIGGETVRVDIRAKAPVVPKGLLFGSTPASSVVYVRQSGPDIHQLTAIAPPSHNGPSSRNASDAGWRFVLLHPRTSSPIPRLFRQARRPLPSSRWHPG